MPKCKKVTASPLVQKIVAHKHVRPGQNLRQATASSRESKPIKRKFSEIQIKTRARFEPVDDTYACNMCASKFMSVPDLMDHHLKQHQTDWYYWCNTCDEQVVSTRLNKHCRSHRVNNVLVSDDWTDIQVNVSGAGAVRMSTMSESDQSTDEDDAKKGNSESDKDKEAESDVAVAEKIMPKIEQIEREEGSSSATSYTLMPGWCVGDKDNVNDDDDLNDAADDSVKAAAEKIAVYCCSFCRATFASLQRLIKHNKTDHITKYEMEKRESQSPVRSPSRSTCPLCTVGFTSPDALQKHLSTEHVSKPKTQGTSKNSKTVLKKRRRVGPRQPQNFTCDICNEQLHTHKLALKAHILGHFREPKVRRRYPCVTCGKSFLSRQNLVQHVAYHTGDLPFHCDLCDLRFPRLRLLKTHHNNNHAEASHPCPDCPFASRKATNLRVHRINAHGLKCDFICSVCGYAAVDEARLNHHVSKFNGECLAPCKYCRVRVPRSRLERHEKSHRSERAFKCSQCPLSFARKDVLRDHENEHAGLKPHMCSVCKMGFSSIYERNAHKVTEHPGVPLQENSDAVAAAGVKYVRSGNGFYRCTRCDYTSRHHSSVNHHFNAHHLENKAWRCQECHFTTDRSSLLRIHVNREHNTPRDAPAYKFTKTADGYQCGSCAFQTAAMDEMCEHIRGSHGVGAGEEKTVWRCDECDFTADSKIDMYAHSYKAHESQKSVNKIWICDICGDFYTVEASYNMHLKTHDGYVPN